MSQQCRFGTRFRETVKMFQHKMRENAICAKTHRFGTRVRETVITNPVLTQNDAKRNLMQKRRFDTRFRERVISNPVLTQHEAKRNLHEKTSFSHYI